MSSSDVSNVSYYDICGESCPAELAESQIHAERQGTLNRDVETSSVLLCSQDSIPCAGAAVSDHS